ncbi:hypothetical protein WISP_134298 [Willisornis vidua]|uniref:ribonuclease H n=1 Tax=Willisornis vidua TaxID=1566151 RepID=A0ABQ9CUT5_9PASS|nr:hypothetical protein WISP_134298 [Willisornis vidua]
MKHPGPQRLSLLSPPDPSLQWDGEENWRLKKVTIDIEGEPMEFRVDTGATYSAMNQLKGSLSDSTVLVVGVSGEVEERAFLRPLDIKFGGKQFDHQFLYMPNSPESLLGRDLLSALEAKIIFETGILKECESEFNTPNFPVKKPNGTYQLVQDLRAVNSITKDIHAVVANPYTLLTSVSEKFQWFTVIDLKDAFFCIPLAPESQHIFAFEWENPDTGRKCQLTWTRLPQGFKSSPTIFGNQLAKELEEWKVTQVKDSPFSYVILQYVDDVFLGTIDRELCCKLTIALLNMLGQGGQNPASQYMEEKPYYSPEDEKLAQALQARKNIKGWPEAFPCKTNQAKEVVRTLLKEIIPRFGVPLGISSDRGPHFIAGIVQGIATALGIDWGLHTPWRPQSSGQVERMNQTLKNQLSKICQEAKIQWPQALPLALLRIRIKPRERMVISPFEILYGKPYHANVYKGDPHLSGDQILLNYVLALNKTLTAIRGALQWNRPLPLENPAHDITTGDQVYVRNWSVEPLKEVWDGPYQVLMTTFTAVKVQGIDNWIHYTRVKKVPTQWTVEPLSPTRLVFRSKP